jgi:hypothetical protein
VQEGDLEPSSVARAVEFCHDTLTSDGANSWLGMIAQNATMTMESWQQAPFEKQGGGTFSHPWTAAPAYIIPRFVMGVRPLQDAWRRVAIRPLPSTKLASASIEVPTMRGLIRLSFTTTLEPTRSGLTFAANITIPGNTFAQVCLPLYLLGAASRGVSNDVASPSSAAHCVTLLHGTEVASARMGGLLCLVEDLGGGEWNVQMNCGM